MVCGGSVDELEGIFQLSPCCKKKKWAPLALEESLFGARIDQEIKITRMFFNSKKKEKKSRL